MSKSKVKSKKAPLYAAMINLSGLFCDKPLKCMRNEDWGENDCHQIGVPCKTEQEATDSIEIYRYHGRLCREL